MQYEVNDMESNELTNQNSKDIKCTDYSETYKNYHWDIKKKTNEGLIHPTNIIIKNTN